MTALVAEVERFFPGAEAVWFEARPVFSAADGLWLVAPGAVHEPFRVVVLVTEAALRGVCNRDTAAGAGWAVTGYCSPLDAVPDAQLPDALTGKPQLVAHA